jgi:hypothetical protein
MISIAAETLVELGDANLWHLEGGMIAWWKAGLPLVGKLLHSLFQPCRSLTWKGTRQDHD